MLSDEDTMFSDPPSPVSTVVLPPITDNILALTQTLANRPILQGAGTSDDTTPTSGLEKDANDAAGEKNGTGAGQAAAILSSKQLANFAILQKSREPTYVSVGGGDLCLFHFPSSKQLIAACPDVVITLQAEKEGGDVCANYCQKANAQWILLDFWYNFYRIKERQQREQLRDALLECIAALKSRKKVLVHCSAGIHRTGIFAYWIFRALGHDQEAIPDLIRTLRPITAERVGKRRIDEAEIKFHLLGMG
eukprot:GEMP01063181.1.p1 GENE.GEMP01063181.1~~GEMP01063181.1.p1  ORF type:complete len:250 (+),score=48.81 GEMP01063181.1:343-1092(+)